MGLFDAINISASGLTAQRLRMDIIANNIANANSTRTESGGPYQREIPIFMAKGKDTFYHRMKSSIEGAGTDFTGGVRVVGIVKDTSPFPLVYDPQNPDANAEGYVQMPNVNIVNEMVDLISATRSYEANVTAIDAAKQMATKAFDIGRG